MIQNPVPYCAQVSGPHEILVRQKHNYVNSMPQQLRCLPRMRTRTHAHTHTHTHAHWLRCMSGGPHGARSCSSWVLPTGCPANPCPAPSKGPPQSSREPRQRHRSRRWEVGKGHTAPAKHMNAHPNAMSHANARGWKAGARWLLFFRPHPHAQAV